MDLGCTVAYSHTKGSTAKYVLYLAQDMGKAKKLGLGGSDPGVVLVTADVLGGQGCVACLVLVGTSAWKLPWKMRV